MLTSAISRILRDILQAVDLPHELPSDADRGEVDGEPLLHVEGSHLALLDDRVVTTALRQQLHADGQEVGTVEVPLETMDPHT
eukprot:6485062-Heterocapsa_arctica.AAC.1